jgi:hypothetical protein
MPFDPELRPVYEDHIRPIAEEMGLSCKRADDFFSTDSVVRVIWSAIFHAKIVIAECTGRNPNVFYEVGIAHTLGRRAVLITQSMDDIPFDLRHLNHITYAPLKMKKFDSDLRETLTSLRENASLGSQE